MIETVTPSNFEDVLPLIKEYQQFYRVHYIDENKNRDFFYQFAIDNSKGILHLLRVEGEAAGFSTIYKGFSSSRAEEVAILNDLFVRPQFRGKGYGKKLIEHAFQVAESLGYQRLQWLTAHDNLLAQQLYDKLDANKSTWCFYAKDI